MGERRTAAIPRLRSSHEIAVRQCRLAAGRGCAGFSEALLRAEFKSTPLAWTPRPSPPGPFFPPFRSAKPGMPGVLRYICPSHGNRCLKLKRHSIRSLEFAIVNRLDTFVDRLRLQVVVARGSASQPSSRYTSGARSSERRNRSSWFQDPSVVSRLSVGIPHRTTPAQLSPGVCLSG